MVTSHVQKLAEFIPLALCFLHAFDRLGIEDTSSAKFKVGTAANMPQQGNGYVHSYMFNITNKQKFNCLIPYFCETAAIVACLS